MRGISGDLDADDPFKVLASHPPRSRSRDERLHAGRDRRAAEDDGFLMLASSSAAGELLLDSTCAAVQAAP